MRKSSIFVACVLACFLAACGVLPPTAVPEPPASARPQTSAPGQEVSLYALGLIGTGYRFGGKNPEAGLDCSGMVSYVFRQAVGLKLDGNAADIARRGRPIRRADLRPG
ncbi:MAG: C40 family peptidase, partial [Candidatus Accumulibacter sp.]|nr:C40 family peptidase [Accumulibacter sp.]